MWVVAPTDSEHTTISTMQFFQKRGERQTAKNVSLTGSRLCSLRTLRGLVLVEEKVVPVDDVCPNPVVLIDGIVSRIQAAGKWIWRDSTYWRWF